METKIIPFDAKMAKDIQDGKIEGRIVTKNGGEARILAFDSKSYFVDSEIECYTTKDKGINKPLVVEYLDVNGDSPCYQVVNLLSNGKLVTWGDSDCDLIIELQEETPVLDDITTSEGFCRTFQKHEFKPFDKVLVRDACCEAWRPDIFSSMAYGPLYSCLRSDWHYCIPYEGNEHLVGTTDKQKDE